MKVYTFAGEEGFEIVQPADPDSYALLNSLINGTPRRDTWVPFPMRLITQGDHRRSLRRSDAPWMVDNVLILRAEAAEALKPFLSNHGEFLPLASEESGLTVFNALRVIDALDEDASTVERFDDGQIWWVSKYAFRKSAIQGLLIFKITSLQPSSLFVGEEFVERWHAAGLKGLEFRQVWEG